MTPHIFRKSLRVPVPVETLFAWHERPGAFVRLSPPWDRPRVLEQSGGIRDGARVVLEVHAGPIPTTWRLTHRDYIANAQFRDVMESGPFAHWEHTHSFRADGPNASVLDDEIAWSLPLGALGDAVAGSYTTDTLERVFAYRHALLAGDIERHAAFAATPRLRVAITGASGMIGTQLAAFLSTGGHEVLRVGRGPVVPGKVDISWDPAKGTIDAAALEGVDAVVHLAGAPIAERWTAEHRKAIKESRVEGTSLLAHTLSRLTKKPRVLLSGSAIGIYGSRGDEILDEHSALGGGYLAEVTRAWEAATAPAAAAGIRVVHLRTGIVQASAGGALAKVALLFKTGLGARLGNGHQWVSPIALDDEIGAIHFAMMRDDIRGPVNLVAPTAVTNADYSRLLADVLHRPLLASAPAFVLRAMLGSEMADETVLASQRVRPTVLEKAGFVFRYPELVDMLRFELGLVP